MNSVVVFVVSFFFGTLILSSFALPNDESDVLGIPSDGICSGHYLFIPQPRSISTRGGTTETMDDDDNDNERKG